MTHQWHVLVTLPHQERNAASSLVERGMAAYLPIMLEPRTTKRKVIEFADGSRILGRRRNNVVLPEMRSLFPGYLFVELPADGSRDRRARDSKGVRDFVRFLGEPAIASAAAVAAVRALEWALLEEHYGEFDLIRGMKGDLVPASRGSLGRALIRRFELGQTVKFAKESVHNAFSANPATIAALDDRGRVTLLMWFLGHQTRVECDASEIEAIRA